MKTEWTDENGAEPEHSFEEVVVRGSRSCFAASCTAKDESGGPHPQGTWGPEGGGEGEWNG